MYPTQTKCCWTCVLRRSGRILLHAKEETHYFRFSIYRENALTSVSFPKVLPGFFLCYSLSSRNQTLARAELYIAVEHSQRQRWRWSMNASVTKWKVSVVISITVRLQTGSWDKYFSSYVHLRVAFNLNFRWHDDDDSIYEAFPLGQFFMRASPQVSIHFQERWCKPYTLYSSAFYSTIYSAHSVCTASF